MYKPELVETEKLAPDAERLRREIDVLLTATGDALEAHGKFTALEYLGQIQAKVEQMILNVRASF